MSIAERVKGWAFNHLPFIFALLRCLKPTVVFKQTGLITRFEDVRDALSVPNVLGVTYAEKMGVITHGSNFFLGMNDTPTYTRDVSNMRIVIRRDDVTALVSPVVAQAAQKIVAQANGQIEVVGQLSSVVPCLLSAQYLGVPGPDQATLFHWTSRMFQYLFYPGNPKDIDDDAERCAEQARAYLDQLIASRQQTYQPGQSDDVIARCLALQQSGAPGMSNLDIRNNLIGILIGMMPTTSKCVVLVLDYLLDHPDLLAGAQRAARADDDETLRQYVLESLRFNSFGAGVLRVALTDYVAAKGTWRATKIPKGTQVLVALQSAMLDGRMLDSPKSFRLDRPAHHYMHFGYGMHTCFGQYINLAQIPLILKALLKCQNLRRAPGAAGQVQYVQPYPVKFNVLFDAPMV